MRQSASPQKGRVPSIRDLALTMQCDHLAGEDVRPTSTGQRRRANDGAVRPGIANRHPPLPGAQAHDKSRRHDSDCRLVFGAREGEQVVGPLACYVQCSVHAVVK